MRILVTGGAGFIGSAFVKSLSNKGAELHIIDNLTYASNISSIQNLIDNNKIQFSKIDICDKANLNKIIFKFKPNKIVHFAAESHVDQSIDSPEKFINTNIIGTYNLLNISLKYYNTLNKRGKETFLFHHVSTDEVYGFLQHPDDEDYNENLSSDKNLFHEKTPYKPSSPYSASKASSDHLVRAWNITYKLPITISNCSNNYGPYQHNEKLIPRVIYCAFRNKPIPVYGNGKQIRDWLYVEDHVEAILTIISKGKIGSTYNVGARCELQNIDLIKLICQILDKKLNKNNDNSYANLITHIRDRQGHDKRYAIDPSKIENELCWKPKTDLKKGLQQTIEFYLDFLTRNK